ncbi:MAG: hypothetical protein GX418_14675 [Clostridiales bacterium]|nr:hypothetical protein [Clostridiales bacterium]
MDHAEQTMPKRTMRTRDGSTDRPDALQCETAIRPRREKAAPCRRPRCEPGVKADEDWRASGKRTGEPCAPASPPNAGCRLPGGYADRSARRLFAANDIRLKTGLLFYRLRIIMWHRKTISNKRNASIDPNLIPGGEVRTCR